MTSSTISDGVGWLQRAAHKLAPSTDPDLQRLRAGILDTLDGADARKALGLTRSALRQAGHRSRNELIRELAERFYSGKPTTRAKALGKELRQYLRGEWRHDQRNGRPFVQSERRQLQFEVCMANESNHLPTSTVRLLDIIMGRVQ